MSRMVPKLAAGLTSRTSEPAVALDSGEPAGLKVKPGFPGPLNDVETPGGFLFAPRCRVRRVTCSAVESVHYENGSRRIERRPRRDYRIQRALPVVHTIRAASDGAVTLTRTRDRQYRNEPQSARCQSVTRKGQPSAFLARGRT